MANSSLQKARYLIHFIIGIFWDTYGLCNMREDPIYQSAGEFEIKYLKQNWTYAKLPFVIPMLRKIVNWLYGSFCNNCFMAYLSR